MFKDSLGIAIRVIIAFALVYLFNALIGTTWTIVVFVTVFVLYVAYVALYKGNSDSMLENLGKAKEYLEYSKKKYAKNENLLSLHESYGLFYLNKVEESIEKLNNVDFSLLKKTKHIYIYYFMKMKFAAEENNPELYKEHLDALIETGVLTLLAIDKEMFEGQYLVMTKKYQEAWNLLMDWIPQIRLRYFIFELEYYLAICHIELERFDDAKAVLDFVSKKNMDFFYIYKCRKLLEETKELEGINLEDELIG